jgi:hypothetical protein
VSARVFETPRPVPGRLVPALAGSAVVVLALPVFVAAGWQAGHDFHPLFSNQSIINSPTVAKQMHHRRKTQASYRSQ